MRLQKLLYSTFFIASLGLVGIMNMSSSSGQMGAYSTGCGGTGCHGSASTATTIALTGIPTSGYVAGVSYPVTLTITNPDSTLVAGGFDLKFGSGTISNPPSNTMQMGLELHHTAPKSSSAGSVSWAFNWTAPSAATVTVNISANMVNGSTTVIGDKWNSTTLTLNQAATSVSNVSENPIAVYPNPCTSQMTLSGVESIQQVKVYSITGQQQIAHGIQKGNTYVLSTENLPIGMYLAVAEGNNAVYSVHFVKK